MLLPVQPCLEHQDIPKVILVVLPTGKVIFQGLKYRSRVKETVLLQPIFRKKITGPILEFIFQPGIKGDAEARLGPVH